MLSMERNFLPQKQNNGKTFLVLASLKFVGTPFVFIMPGEIIVDITCQDKCSYRSHFEEFSGLNLIISILPCEEQTNCLQSASCWKVINIYFTQQANSKLLKTHKIFFSEESQEYFYPSFSLNRNNKM